MVYCNMVKNTALACRCVHIHGCLGRLPRLRSYYLAQRRLQITADLAPPAAFLEAYQAYLSQVRGPRAGARWVTVERGSGMGCVCWQ